MGNRLCDKSALANLQIVNGVSVDSHGQSLVSPCITDRQAKEHSWIIIYPWEILSLSKNEPWISHGLHGDGPCIHGRSADDVLCMDVIWCIVFSIILADRPQVVAIRSCGFLGSFVFDAMCMVFLIGFADMPQIVTVCVNDVGAFVVLLIFCALLF